MALPRIYLETSVISYLTARPSRYRFLAARQQMTREWWEQQRPGFESFVSQLVLDEAATGDLTAMKSRLDAAAGIPVLDVTSEAEQLALAMIRARLIPETVTADALHVACAVVHRMHYLLTWNCKHLAHARVRQGVRDLVAERGYDPVEICTPEELMEGRAMQDDAVMTEVRRVRAALSAKYGNNVHKLAQALREHQKAGSTKVVSFAKSPRKANGAGRPRATSRKPARTK